METKQNDGRSALSSHDCVCRCTRRGSEASLSKIRVFLNVYISRMCVKFFLAGWKTVIFTCCYFCTYYYVEIAIPLTQLFQRPFSSSLLQLPHPLIQLYWCQKLCQQPPFSATISSASLLFLSFLSSPLNMFLGSFFGIGSHMSKFFKTMPP